MTRLRFLSAIVPSVILLLIPSLSPAQVWEGAQPIDPGSGYPFNSAMVAIGPNAGAIAVYRDWNGAGDRLYAAHYVPGSGWAAPSAIDGNLPGSIGSGPSIAIAANGNAMACYTQDNGVTNPHAYATYYTSGATWGAPFIADAGGAGDTAYSPRAAFDGAGNALAVFSYGSLPYYLYGRRWSSATSSWTTAQTRIDKSSWSTSADQQISMNATGDAMVIYEQSDGVDWRINATRYAANIGWITPPTQLDNPAKDDAYDPYVALNSSGNAIAVFWQRDLPAGLPYHVYANRFNGSTWLGPEKIDSTDSDSALYPRIAYSDDGTGIAVFKQHDGTHERIYENRFDGSAWVGAGIIDAATGQDAADPRVAIDAQGNATAIFEQSDGTYTRLYANRYVSNSGWTGAAIIDAGTGKDVSDSNIASDGSGNAMAVFVQKDASNNGRIYANRFIPPAPTPTATPTAIPAPTFVPFNLRLESTVLPTTGTLVIKADVLVEGTPYAGVPFLPYVAVEAGNSLYFVLSGNRVTTRMVPYATAGKGKKKYFKLSSNISNIELARIPITGLPIGQYPVLGAFLDSRGRLLGQIAVTGFKVQ